MAVSIAISAAVTAALISQGVIVPATQVVSSNTVAVNGTTITMTGTAGNIYLAYDPTVITDTALLVQELNAMLDFLQTAGSISV